MPVAGKGTLTHAGKETPLTAYERAMRNKMFHVAATIAKDHGLGRGLVLEAAFKAFCRYDALHMDQAADQVLAQFGFTNRFGAAPRGEGSELIRAVQAYCQFEADIPTAVIMKGPTGIQ